MNTPDPDIAAVELKAMQDSIYREKSSAPAARHLRSAWLMRLSSPTPSLPACAKSMMPGAS
jgi:hypothetical protein